MSTCYLRNQKKKKKGKEQCSRTPSTGGKPLAPQTAWAMAMPTCIDDDANDSFRVSDCTPSQQQVFFIQPSLLPIVMYPVEEKVAGITGMFSSTLHLNQHYLGKRRSGCWEEKQGTPGVSGLSPWISARPERELCSLVSGLLEVSQQLAVCLFCPWALWDSKIDISLPPVPDTGLLKTLLYTVLPGSFVLILSLWLQFPEKDS